MRLTREADYAVRIIVDLAAAPGVLVPRRAIQRRQEVPAAHLAKIVQLLRRAGLVKTWRGARGGVTLALPPEKITLRRVVEAVEGPLALNLCLVAPGTCSRDSFCPVHPVWRRVQAILVRELDAVTAASLAQPGRQLLQERSLPTKGQPMCEPKERELHAQLVS
jgi:Rrf2 family protein